MKVTILVIAVAGLTTWNSKAATISTALVQLDSKNFGYTNCSIHVVEFERNARTSKIKSTWGKCDAAGEPGFFLMRAFYEVAKARGAGYFVQLKRWDDPKGGMIDIVGFTNRQDADVKKEFGEEFSYENESGQKRHFMEVSEWQMLFDPEKASISLGTFFVPASFGSTTNIPVTFGISEERCVALPKWTPTSNDPVPLDVRKACALAKASYEKRETNAMVVAVREVSLQRTHVWRGGLGDLERWFYKVEVEPVDWRNGNHFIGYAVVLMDGTVVEPGLVNADRVSYRRVDTAQRAASASKHATTSSVGLKGNYEVVQLKVLKAFTVDGDEGKYRSYVVKWKNHDIVVQDMLAETDKNEGDPIQVMVHTSEFRGQKTLHFMSSEPPRARPDN